MGIFSRIKEAIFGKKAQAAEPQATTTGVDVATPSTVPASTTISDVDVVSILSAMPGADNLNWRSSIVDLMKLVGMESSLSERKELAQELGYTGDLNGSAEMNVWLHKAVMREIAKNGGVVPAELMD